MTDRSKNLFLGFIVGLLVVGSGAVEDWFGRTYYADDAIGYFDVSKAISHGEWSAALNPYWSIGYPMILSATRWMFPPGNQGEWIGVHVVNLVIFVGIYLSFLYFLKVATIYTAKVNGAEANDSGKGFVFAIGTILFLLWQLLIGNVSRISPDPLVSGVFFLIMATVLHFFMRPSVKIAVIMGLLMGCGYILKAVFLPISVAVLLVVFLHSITRSRADRLPAISRLAWALPALALVALPYITALSQAVGTFTLGESGSLNYAWNVNNMPRSCNWQGGPAPFGMPIHPTHLVGTNPPVFTFAEPFHVTYPPWFNPPYWYQGYHHFFNIKSQLFMLKANLSLLLHFFFVPPHLFIKILAAGLLSVAGLFLMKDRLIWWKRLLALWPLYLPPIAAISIYLLVILEPRYVVGFLLVLLITPFLPLFVPTQLVSKKVGYALVILLAIGSVAILAENKKEVFRRALQLQPYTSDEAWQIGLYLAQSGVHPGDKVASVRAGGTIDCTWAYVGGVHVVAEIGNDAFDPKDQEKDIQLFIRNPEVQKSVFDLFRQAGALLVVVRDVDEPVQGSGWERIPGTKSWLHRLDETAQ